MKCPVCGGAELVHDIRDVPYAYKNQHTTIPAVSGDFCSACGEVVLDSGDSDRVAAAMVAFQREVNASYVSPDYIAQVRHKLKLTQRDAAEIFGGGVNAFSRYESGTIRPPVALVKLLRVLDKHPELLSEVRET